MAKVAYNFSGFNNKISLYINKFKMYPYILLGERMKAQKSKYHSLSLQLRQARMATSFEMYLSNAIFYSVLVGIIGAIIGILLAYIIVNVVGLPARITNLTFNPKTAWLLQYKEISISIFIIFFLALLLGGGTYMFFLVYPSFKAGERKGSIDKNLPYAVTFMYALSRGGMNIIQILRSLSKCTETYQEAAKEADVILRDMDYFGNDLRTALHNICETTPSENFRDLMYNLLTVIDSGGSIPKYFRDKSEQYLQKAKVEQKGFLETLALIAESYVTAFVAGPLFIIILGVMMSVMGSPTQVMLYAIVYAVIPIGSLMFVMMIAIMTPGATGEAPLLTYNLKSKKEYIVAEDDPEKPLFDELKKSRKLLNFKKVMHNPLKPFFEKPIYTLAVSAPVAIIFLVISLMGAVRSPDILDYMDDRLVYIAFMIIIPLMIFHELKIRHENIIQSQLPDFLKKLASTNETGMTLRQSIKLMSRVDIGMLSKEIKKIWRDIDWGLAINEALIRFSNRIRTHISARAVTLLTKANESSGDIGEVLSVAARDATAEQELKRERSINMLIYIIIIYISFMVFVGIIYIISTTFLAEMVKAGEKMSTGSGGAVPLSLSVESLGMYNRLFFHAALIQGFCSGLIAGTMGEGSVMSGLKHSLIMLTIAYLIFVLFVL